MTSRIELEEELRQRILWRDTLQIVSWCSLLCAVLTCALMFWAQRAWGIVAITSMICMISSQFGSHHFELLALRTRRKLHEHDPTEEYRHHDNPFHDGSI